MEKNRVSSVQFSHSVVSDSLATPWTVAHQASLSITNAWGLLKLMSVESVMPYDHLILCHPILLLPSIFPSIRVFSNESAHWCFWTVVLEKTLETPLDCKEIHPVHPKGNQSWIFIERTDAEADTPILSLPDAKSWFIWKERVSYWQVFLSLNSPWSLFSQIMETIPGQGAFPVADDRIYTFSMLHVKPYLMGTCVPLRVWLSPWKVQICMKKVRWGREAGGRMFHFCIPFSFSKG